MVHRRDTLRASKIMQERAMNNPKIEFIWNAAVDEILGTDTPVKHVTGVRLTSTVEDKKWEMPIDGVFVAIGHKPNSDVFTEWLGHDENGYLHHKPDSSHTEIEGVFVSGDVADHVYRQAVTAAGSGCMAAIDAERYLEARGL